MLRALFFREFSKSWLVHAGLFAAVFGTVTLFERVPSGGATRSQQSLDESAGLSLLLIVGLVLSGLISGERCFSQSFKGRFSSFLLTLPRIRGSIWLAYTGGRLTGALAAMPVIGFARPALLPRGIYSPQAPVEAWPILATALTMYLVYFFAGAALSFASGKEILVYLTGFPLLTTLLVLIASSASYGFSPETLLENPEFLRDLSLGSLLLALAEAAIALRAFCRGELQLGRRMLQTLAEVGLAYATFAVLAPIVFSSTRLAVFRDEWWTAYPDAGASYAVDSRPVSADGRFLFIWQHLRERTTFTRLAVVDLKTGGTTDWLERPGIHQISWSTSGAVLNVLATDNAPSDCFVLPCEGSTSWHRLSPDLRTLSVRKFAGIGFLHQLDDSLLLLTRQESTGRVYRLSDRDGSSQKILASETVAYNLPSAWSLRQGAVVVFPGATNLHAWWLDRKDLPFHEASVQWRAEESYYLVGPRILSYQEAREEVLSQVLPPLSRGINAREPFLPEAGGPLEFGPGRFFFLLSPSWNTVEIWRYDSRLRTWGRLLSKLPITKSFVRSFPLLVRHVNSDSFDIDYQTWTLAGVVEEEGNERLFLYDNPLARSVPNTAVCGPGEEGGVRLERAQGVHGLLAQLTCSGPSGRQRHRFLEIVPGSGRVRDLPRHSLTSPAGFFDRWIYLDPDGISIWVSTTGEVWQAGPGHKSRRLNPPETS
jgi:hypothetical protein